MTEETTAISASEWREFWETRGMRELQIVLWAAWGPIGGTPPGECDRYAFRIASLLGSRATRAAIAKELGRIRRDLLDVEPDPVLDHEAAEKISDWYEHSIRTRDW